MTERKRRGRPEFVPSKAQRSRVAAAAGAGMAHEEIALGLGISRNTLSKHFAHELTTGAYRKRLEVMEAMLRAAKRGSVSAAKAYMAMTPGVEAPPSAPAQPEAPKPAKLGKKEQAQADAGTAQSGTGWDDLLPDHTTPPTLPH